MSFSTASSPTKLVLAANDGARLESALSVTNTCDARFSFTAALYTYFRVVALHAAAVLGLDSRRFVDATAGEVDGWQGDSEVRCGSWVGSQTLVGCEVNLR